MVLKNIIPAEFDMLVVSNVSSPYLSLYLSILINRSLIELDASFNDLTFLPTNIGYGLGNLQKFYIHLNKLKAIPNSIGEMTSLKILDAHFNSIHGLPHSIGKLTNLEFLNMGSNFNDLTEVPESIGDLINLRDLDLSNNQIRAIPERIYQLQNLSKLNLDQNPLVVPPMDIVNNGVQAVKEYMMKRRLEMLEDEQKGSLMEKNKEGETGWVGWGKSTLHGFYSGVSNVSSHVGRKPPMDPYLDQEL